MRILTAASVSGVTHHCCSTFWGLAGGGHLSAVSFALCIGPLTALLLKLLSRLNYILVLQCQPLLTTPPLLPVEWRPQLRGPVQLTVVEVSLSFRMRVGLLLIFLLSIFSSSWSAFSIITFLISSFLSNINGLLSSATVFLSNTNCFFLLILSFLLMLIVYYRLQSSLTQLHPKGSPLLTTTAF